MSEIVVYNPLPQALRHYSVEIMETLSRGGYSAELIEHHTEGKGGLHKIGALLRHILHSRRLRREKRAVVVVWPLLGWLELLLWRNAKRPRYVIVHDPEPLRKQFGLDTWSAALARGAGRRSRPTIVSHSVTATRVIQNEARGYPLVELPHPITKLRTNRDTRRAASTVTVTGQYKPTRNVDLLMKLPRHLPGWNLRIVGRGWPDLEGWTVVEGFVDEDVLESELCTASVVLIPYAKYFQSGVAVRALECGTPVVGSSSPFLDELLHGGQGGCVVDAGAAPSTWADAVRAAERLDIAVAHDRFISLVDERWKRALTGRSTAGAGLGS